MKLLLWNVLLAWLWVLVTGAITLPNLVLGFCIGFLVLALSPLEGGKRRYLLHWWYGLRLLLFFMRELLLSSFRVVYDVLTPTHHMRPAIVAVPLEVSTDAEITVLSSLISLTPGTLCLDVSTDRRVMYIHAMYVEDKERFKAQIKAGLEKNVLAAMR
jgi:multicomponent Na+:H+ antiporter subunit E